ncbi:MAG TPA: questin oxidase family protein, partial [Stellaceae bacterium]|nr:questin oxidase family protein [Stellaceae bacterium]
RRPAVGEPVDWSGWRKFLGRRDSFPQWSRLFAAELNEAPWRAVLDRWALRLAPGYSAAATHGVIRVGHAARGLAESETRVRLRELADALASWAATYATLPEATPASPRRLGPRSAIAAVPLVPREQRGPGNIAAALGRLAEFPEFAPAIDLVDLSGDPEALVAALSEVFTRVYLANAVDTRSFIVFVHGVTAVHALGNLLPHVGAATGGALARYAWQAGCGLLASFGGGTAMAEGIEPQDDDPSAQVDRAVTNGDEHIIKFTEACVARHKIAPSRVYPAAIRHALGVVGAALTLPVRVPTSRATKRLPDFVEDQLGKGARLR